MAKDIYWNNVVCLMHCDDLYEVVTQTNATAVGTPTFDSTIVGLGTSSLRVTAGNYITLPDSDKWDFGTGAFTIEFLMRFSGPSNGTYRTWMGHNVGTYPYWMFQADYYSRPQFFWYDSGGGSTAVYANSITTTGGGWFAVCLQRDASGATTFWCNALGTAQSGLSWATSALSNNITGGTGVMQFGSADANMWLDEIRITKGVARYTTSTYAVPSAPYPEADHEIYQVLVSENLNAKEYTNSPGGQVFTDVDEWVYNTGTIIAGHTRSLSDLSYALDVPPPTVMRAQAPVLADTATVTEASAVSTTTILTDFANLADSLGVKARYTSALLELARVQDALSVGRPVTVQDTSTITWALATVQGATLAERLGVSELLNFPVRYKLSAADALRVYDALANFLHFDLAETITVSETMASLSRHVLALNQSATITDAAATKFRISAVAQDDAVLDDAFNAKMIFKPEVREQVVFTVMFASPSGGVTTWAVNTRTGAVSEYENFAFNSFAQNGFHYLGAASDGLYALDGADDAGTPTIAHIKSGYAQFGGSRFTSFKAAYLGLRGDGDIYLKLDTADGKSYTYQTVIQDQETTKVRLGKGLRARYFAFELITVGQDFDLDTVEFLPLVAQRRV